MYRVSMPTVEPKWKGSTENKLFQMCFILMWWFVERNNTSGDSNECCAREITHFTQRLQWPPMLFSRFCFQSIRKQVRADASTANAHFNYFELYWRVLLLFGLSAVSHSAIGFFAKWIFVREIIKNWEEFMQRKTEAVSALSVLFMMHQSKRFIGRVVTAQNANCACTFAVAVI